MAIIQQAAVALVLVAATVGLSGCFEGRSIYLKCDGNESIFIKDIVVGIVPRSEFVILHKTYPWGNYDYITSDNSFVPSRLGVEVSGTNYVSDANELVKNVGSTRFLSLNIVSGHMKYFIDNKYNDMTRFYDLQCKPQKRLDVIN